MRLEIVARSLAALLLLVSLAEARGQSATEKRIFQIPYAGASELRASNALLVAPFVRIGEPWKTFSRRSPRTEEEAALQELFAAVYGGDVVAAAARINPPREAAQGKAFEDYVNAFKASQERAGDLEVEGYFPLSGRVRFVLRPTRPTERYRLITMRAGPQGRLRFDETQAPNKVDSVLNAIFRVLKDMPLETRGVPANGYFTVTAEEIPEHGNVQLAVKARLVNADLKQLDPRLSDAPLQFYKECLSLPEKGAMDRFFQCFQPEVQPRLREVFMGMSAEKQSQTMAAAYSPRHIDFVVENPTSEVIYYRSLVAAVVSRDWIERTSGGSFVLLNPLASFPLDDLLSSPQIRTSLAATLNRAAATQSK